MRTQATRTPGRGAAAYLFLFAFVCLFQAGCEERSTFTRLAESRVWSAVENETETTLQLEEVWSTRDGPGLGYVTDMAAWADGTVWIADADARQVWQVGPAGEIQCCVAVEADGDVADLATLSNGGAVVIGLASRRATLYDSNKRFASAAAIPDIWTRGVAALPAGGFVVSGGFRGAEAGQYAIHQFDEDGAYMDSFHPALQHDDQRAVRRLSGGPVAVTAAGDLLLSEAAPFRITRYRGARPQDGHLVVEDHTIVSPTQLERALVPDDPNITYSPRWNQSIYIGETSNGHILDVVHVYPDNPRARTRSHWVVATADGGVVARSTFAVRFTVWDKTPGGGYLVSYADPQTGHELAAEVQVLLNPVEGE